MLQTQVAEPNKKPQGLKPEQFIELAARLKPCPSTQTIFEAADELFHRVLLLFRKRRNEFD